MGVRWATSSAPRSGRVIDLGGTRRQGGRQAALRIIGQLAEVRLDLTSRTRSITANAMTASPR